MKFIEIRNISIISGLIWPFLGSFWQERPWVEWYRYWRWRKRVTGVIPAGLPVPLPTYTTFLQVCGIFIKDTYSNTRVVVFRFSTHSWDMYCIFTCVWHVYSRHLPTKLLMYILKMHRKSCIFPRTITWTPGCFFLDFLHIPGTCTAFLHVYDIFI